MRRLTYGGVVAAITAIALLAAPAAFAQSTFLYPAEDSFSTSATPVTFGEGGTYHCTFNPGTFKVTGPAVAETVTAKFTTPPTITNCTNSGGTEVSAEVKGAWTLSFKYGSVATINIPTGGIRIFLYSNSAPWAWQAILNNGLTSPMSVPSTLELLNTPVSGSLMVLGSGLSTLTDVTHPGSLLVMG
jgi:hypothetical protein